MWASILNGMGMVVVFCDQKRDTKKVECSIDVRLRNDVSTAECIERTI